MSFIRGHILVHLLSPAGVSLDILHIYLAILSAALFGVGHRGGFSSHIFTPASWRGWHMPIELFCFTSFIPTTWIFSCTNFSVVSNMDSILMVPLRSWGFFDFWCPTFSGGGSIVSGELLFHYPFTRKLLRFFLPPDLLGGLYSWLWVVSRGITGQFLKTVSYGLLSVLDGPFNDSTCATFSDWTDLQLHATSQ